jgi:4-hydroxybenzoate polyprenyltransferase
MLTRLRHILEMIRFSHTLFALPFALLAMLMAACLSHQPLRLADPYHHSMYIQIGQMQIRLPDGLANLIFPISPSGTAQSALLNGSILLGILLCMVFARSAAMAFNRIVDWKIDAQNPRTDKRHIPAGILTLPSVIVFCVVCSLLFVASTLLFLPNQLPLYLSLPVLLFLLGYSYAKRFTSFAHFWLGAALMLAPICAWIAVRGEVVMQDPADLLPAVVLGGAVLLWVAGFDIIYACQDAAFDKQAGLHSVPVRLGVKNALRLAAVCHAGMIALLAALPWFYPLFGWVYWTGIAAVAVLLVYEHSLVREDDLTRVNVAFFNVNAIVSIGLLLIGALDLMM